MGVHVHHRWRLAHERALRHAAIQGDAVSYSLACGNRTIDSVTTVHGETSERTLTTTVQGAKPTVTPVKARRTGACTPAS